MGLKSHPHLYPPNLLLEEDVFPPLSFSLMAFSAFCPTPLPQAGDVSMQGKGSSGLFSLLNLAETCQIQKECSWAFLTQATISEIKKKTTCRCLMFYHFFASCEATYTLGILIRNSKCYEKKAKKKKACDFWGMFSYLCTSCCLEIFVPLPTLTGDLSPSSMPLERPWHRRKATFRKKS